MHDEFIAQEDGSLVRSSLYPAGLACHCLPAACLQVLQTNAMAALHFRSGQIGSHLLTAPNGKLAVKVSVSAYLFNYYNYRHSYVGFCALVLIAMIVLMHVLTGAPRFPCVVQSQSSLSHLAPETAFSPARQACGVQHALHALPPRQSALHVNALCMICQH